MVFPHFGLKNQQPEFNATPEYLGGKGAGLVWMSENGVPVPPGFVIPTDIWKEYDKKPKTTLKEISKVLPQYLKMLKDHFGYMPLLSVRSGARVSMPGLMDTILNVGIDNNTAEFWFSRLGKECYENSLHRLITMYGSVVKGIDRQLLEKQPSPFIAEAVYETESKEKFPEFFSQLMGAIEAVFKSWDNERANVYRKLHKIPREWGTAVTVQAMVFGNLNKNSGTGVLFTRNADTGEKKITGEFLDQAQGEDVVAGIRTPMPLQKMSQVLGNEVYIELCQTVVKLESLKKDVQDVEFTIQDGKLFILQTRNAKRTPQAAVKIAVDMVKEGMITRKEAIQRVTPRQLDLAEVPVLDPSFKKPAPLMGIPACSGVVSGKPVFNAQAAIDCKEPCILITQETTPDDIAGMLAAKGVITMEGGFTSHAAVVARGENKPCITGVGQDLQMFKVPVISMDGSTGKIWFEKVPVIEAGTEGPVAEFKNLVLEEGKFVPVFTEVPKTQMKEGLLFLGLNVLNTEKAVEMVVKSLEKVDKLYVDFSADEEAEHQFFQLVATHAYITPLLSELEKFVGDNPSLTGRVTLINNYLSSANVKSLYKAHTLESLILAKEEVAVGDLGSSEAVEWVLKHKVAEGVKFVSLGKFIKDTKSMVSVHQALVGLRG